METKIKLELSKNWDGTWFWKISRNNQFLLMGYGETGKDACKSGTEELDKLFKNSKKVLDN